MYNSIPKIKLRTQETKKCGNAFSITGATTKLFFHAANSMKAAI